MPGQIQITQRAPNRDIALAIVKQAIEDKAYDIAVQEFSED